MEAKRRSLFAIILSSLLVLAFAGSAMAQQPRQEGLVNVLIEDVYVQIPIAVAANVCDVNVNVLARQSRDAAPTCAAVADPDATIAWNQGGNGNGNQNQRGLVNVLLADIVVQVPIGIAANICDVNANVLAEQERTEAPVCVAQTFPTADLGL
jgi:hypothetical protein